MDPKQCFLAIFGNLGHLAAASVELPGLVQLTDAREGSKAIFLAHPAMAGPDYRRSRGPEGNFLVHLRWASLDATQKGSAVTGCALLWIVAFCYALLF